MSSDLTHEPDSTHVEPEFEASDLAHWKLAVDFHDQQQSHVHASSGLQAAHQQQHASSGLQLAHQQQSHVHASSGLHRALQPHHRALQPQQSHVHASSGLQPAHSFLLHL